MTPAGAVVLALGGSGSAPSLSPQVLEAVRAVVRALSDDADPMDAAAAGVVVLEDSDVFNAGLGSSIRYDGLSIQMDAAIMDSEGRLGVVAGISRVSNPVLIARELASTLTPVLVGGGASGFARTRGYDVADLETPRARRQRVQSLQRLWAGVGADAGGSPDAASTGDGLVDARAQEDAAGAENLNDGGTEQPLEPPANVAVLVRTPEGVFVAAASDGGRPAALPGQVGAVAVPGAAIVAGRNGAVAASGPDNLIINELLARMVYERMAGSRSPQQAIAWGFEQLPADVDVAFAAIDERAFHVEARGPLAWASWSSDGEATGEGKP